MRKIDKELKEKETTTNKKRYFQHTKQVAKAITIITTSIKETREYVLMVFSLTGVTEKERQTVHVIAYKKRLTKGKKRKENKKERRTNSK